MGILEGLNRKARKFDILDLQLAQGSAIFFALIIAKLIPEILEISIWVFVALLAVCGMKPFYVFWIQNGNSSHSQEAP
jgi:hypothetical protein